jgi:NADH dehydrogenase
MASKSIKQRVIIIGGGFGGVKAALDLIDDSRFNVTLISPDENLRYYPTLYRTATGGKYANSSIPYSVLFREKPISLIKDSATTIDRKAKTIATESGAIYEYDILIIGLGVVTNYFGIPGMSEFSYSIKSQQEVERFKAHLHKQLIDDNKPDMNYVIVGAGPTGIELAGSLPGYLRQIMNNHGVLHKKFSVNLVEAAPKLLPRLPKDSSKMVSRQLKKLGVSVYTNSVVEGEDVNSLTVNGNSIATESVVWTAGVMNHPFFAANSFALMNHGKVAVDVYLKADDNVYVIGDNANTPYSGLAQTAIHDGAFVAHNLKRVADGKDMKSYKPKKGISVIPAGPNWAAVVWGRFRIYGWAGYALREAADFIGFHDLEPWDTAAKQWLTEFEQQDNCPVCVIAKNSD